MPRESVQPEEVGITDARGRTINTQRPGEIKTFCPQCRFRRKPEHRSDLPLSVSVKADGDWVANCHNCGFTTSRTPDGRREAPNGAAGRRYRRPHLVGDGADDRMLDWFAIDRSINEHIIARNKVVATRMFMPGDGKEVEVIAFPYYRDGELLNVKYRSYTKSFRQEKGAEPILFKLDDLKNSTDAIITEGEIDALSWEVAGFPNAVSIPDGSPEKELPADTKKFTFLENCAPQLKHIKRFFLALDADTPGELMRAELIRRLGPARCWNIRYPEGCKDSNEVLVKHGWEKLRECRLQAVAVPIPSQVSHEEFLASVIKNHARGLPPRGMPLPWRGLANLMQIVPGQFYLITGFTGHGKTDVLMAMMIAAMNNGWPVGVWSAESDPELFIVKMLEKQLHAPFFMESGSAAPRMSQQEMLGAMALFRTKLFMLKTRPLETDRKHKSTTIDYIIDGAKDFVLRHGIRMMVVDPFNMISRRNVRLDDKQHVNDVIGVANTFAKDADCATFMVAHPRKPAGGDDSTPPSVYSPSGSGDWANMSDFVVAVHRDTKTLTALTEVHVHKVRWQPWYGHPGVGLLARNSVGIYEDAGLGGAV